MLSSLDIEQYKDAMRLCKAPDMANIALVRALHAFCLSCLGDRVEALRMCEAVMRAPVLDKNVIDTLSPTLRNLREEHMLAPCYEKAIAASPNDHELVIDLFFLYTKQCEFKKMQLTAQKLYKALNNTSFLFWSVTSQILQPDLPPAMYTVAERMLQKVLYDPKNASQPGAEEVELYVEVLKRQSKLAEAVSALTDLSGRKVDTLINDENDFKVKGSLVKLNRLRLMSLKVEILKSRCQKFTGSDSLIGIGEKASATDREELEQCVTALQAELEAILALYPDQWPAHTTLIELLVERSLVDEHRAFLAEQQCKHPKLRGPFLAEMYLATTARAQGKASIDIEPLLLNYMTMFSTRSCCFSDMKPYIESLSTSKPDALSDIAMVALGKAGENFKMIEDLVNGRPGDEAAVTVDAITLTEGEGEGEQQSMQAEPVGSEGPDSSEAGADLDPEAAKAAKIKARNKAKKAKQRERKKEKAAEQKAPSGDVEALAEAKVDEMRNQLLDLLCSLCKHEQIYLFCTVMNHAIKKSSAADWAGALTSSITEHNPRRQWMYELTRTRCLGGVGGDREVQPGDELLLVSCLAHKLRFRDRSEFSHDAVQSKADAGAVGTAVLSSRDVSLLVQWASVLELGITGSPHNHVPKLEYLEPLRMLAAGETAMATYGALKARYIQNDSMSYLILPILIESGLFTEAARQNKIACNFHTGAGRDTADMMSECFKHSNYAKALELNVFRNKCKRSTQLALSKVEMALLDLTDSTHSAQDAALYLETSFAGNLSEKFDSAALLDSLSDNFDFNLLVRADLTSSEEQAADATRCIQMKSRISRSYKWLYVLWTLLKTDKSATEEGNPGTDNSGDGCSPDDAFETMNSKLRDLKDSTACDTSANAVEETYIQWDQIINCGGSEFEHTLSITALAYFDLHHLMKSNGEITLARADETLSLLALVETQLCLGECTRKLRHPDWIRRMSAFTRTVCTFLSLLIQAAYDLPAYKSNAATQEVVKKVANRFEALLEGVVRAIPSAVDMDAINSEADRLVESSKAVAGFEGEAVQRRAAVVVSQVLSSQALSYTRLRTVLKAKLLALQEAKR